jgi:hypothetical protein
MRVSRCAKARKQCKINHRAPASNPEYAARPFSAIKYLHPGHSANLHLVTLRTSRGTRHHNDIDAYDCQLLVPFLSAVAIIGPSNSSSLPSLLFDHQSSQIVSRSRSPRRSAPHTLHLFLLSLALELVASVRPLLPPPSKLPYRRPSSPSLDSPSSFN